MARVATPEALTLPVPMLVAPLKKSTVPSEAPVGVGVMVAVRVTDCPKVDGFGVPVSVVVVDVVIVTLCAVEVEVRKSASPE